MVVVVVVVEVADQIPVSGCRVAGPGSCSEEAMAEWVVLDLGVKGNRSARGYPMLANKESLCLDLFETISCQNKAEL